jgi:chromosome partitioning protein
MIIEELRAAGVPLLSAHLNERAAFKSLFTYRQTLEELDPATVNGLQAAVSNADRLAGEIIEVIRNINGKAAA